MVAVKLDDLALAFDFVSSGAPSEHQAFLCKDTGVIHLHSELGDVDVEELPDDIESDKYILIPHKNDLELGKRLALRFSAQFLPDREDKVREIFSRRGGLCPRFKDLLDYSGKLQQWYDYEANAAATGKQKTSPKGGFVFILEGSKNYIFFLSAAVTFPIVSLS